MKRARSLILKLLLAAVAVGLTVVVAEAGMRWYYYHKHGPDPYALWPVKNRLLNGPSLFGPSGVELNDIAWKATFTERNLPVPPNGPREGFWGARSAQRVFDPDSLMGREGKVSIPGLLEVDDQGLQHAGPADGFPHLLIIGASVAYGANSSSIDTVYFVRLAELLKPVLPRLRITVLARGGCVSTSEVAAFILRGQKIKPDAVMFCDGLNDLTNIPEGDDPAIKALDYVRNMKMAQQVALERKEVCIFALQPFLGTKKHKTALERRLLDLTHPDYEQTYNFIYQATAQRLNELAQEHPRESYFVDCSGTFDDAFETTFVDQWHFADAGHELLAHRMASALGPILARIPAADAKSSPAPEAPQNK